MENTSDKQDVNCEGNKEENTHIKASPMKDVKTTSIPTKILVFTDQSQPKDEDEKDEK